MPDKRLIRDCYAQVRSIRRLMLQLADNLGDLSVAEARDKPGESSMSAMSDALTDMEHRLHQMQDALRKASE